MKLYHRKWKIDCRRSAIINRIHVHDSVKRGTIYESGIKTIVGCWSLMTLWGIIKHFNGQSISTTTHYPKRAKQKIIWSQIGYGNTFLKHFCDVFATNNRTVILFNSLFPGIGGANFKISISVHMLWALPAQWLSGAWHWTSMMINHHRFWLLLDTIRQQAISIANIDPNAHRYIMALCHNELILSVFISTRWYECMKSAMAG